MKIERGAVVHAYAEYGAAPFAQTVAYVAKMITIPATVVGGAIDGNSNVTTYTRDQKILVVGDGDFSFSHGLVKHRGGQGVPLALRASSDPYPGPDLILNPYFTP